MRIINFNQLLSCAASVLATLVLCSCTTSAPATYAPVQSQTPNMSVDEARNIVLKLARPPALFFDISENSAVSQAPNMDLSLIPNEDLGSSVFEISNVDVQSTRMRVTVTGNKRYSIPLNDLTPMLVGRGTSAACNGFDDGYMEVYLNKSNKKIQGFYFAIPTEACWFVSYNHDNPLTRALTSVRENSALEMSEGGARQLVDALLVLKNATIKSEGERYAKLLASGVNMERTGRNSDALDLFAQAYGSALTPEQSLDVLKTMAQLIRAMPDKPMLSENVRKFEVQAVGAVNDNKLADAADFYGRAIDVAPWYPANHYNRAFILSKIGDLPTAIQEMKYYLVLAPNAPDARAAQDNIYDWERKVGTQN